MKKSEWENEVAVAMIDSAVPSEPRSAKASLPSRMVRLCLTLTTVLFIGLFVMLPLVNVFAQAFSKGLSGYVHTFYAASPPRGVILPIRQRLDMVRASSQARRTRSAIAMTLVVGTTAVAFNAVFGLAAAWAVGKFRFRGKTLLTSLIDLPFSVSPVVSGLIFVLLFGREGVLGNWATHLKWPDPFSIYWRGFSGHIWPLGASQELEGIIFTPLGIVLSTMFVTFPFVARALIPLMESQGIEEEQAALSLGASGWQTFRRVTLPNIRWALLYGIVLCTCRAYGEFGAVSVVSGSTDANDTMPLRVEKLWQGYNTQAAFAVASLLASLALITLLVKAAVDWRRARTVRGAGEVAS
jgi:sulfate/thiosulfate transport system permease protein